MCGPLTLGIHLNLSSIEIPVEITHSPAHQISWVSIGGMQIYCATPEGAEGIAAAFRAAISQRSQVAAPEQAREAKSK